MKRTLTIIAALLFGLIGLGMSLCGGGFLLGALLDAVQRRTTEYSGIAAIALPCALIGIGITWMCFRILVRKSREDQDPPSPTGS